MNPQPPSGTLKAYSPELQPSKCPDHFRCQLQTTKATMCLIKKDKVYPRLYPPQRFTYISMRCILFLWPKESDGISNGSIIMVCFSFWQKISSRSSRWSRPAWAELIRGNQKRECTFNNIDAGAEESVISIRPSYRPRCSLLVSESKQCSGQLAPACGCCLECFKSSLIFQIIFIPLRSP